MLINWRLGRSGGEFWVDVIPFIYGGEGGYEKRIKI